MQVPLLQNILNPQAENQKSLLMGEKKIGSNEADIFSKLLQGTIDVPKMQKAKLGNIPEVDFKEDSQADNKASQTVDELLKNEELKSLNIQLQDNEGLAKILGNNEQVALMQMPEGERQDFVKLIASNPKLIEIFSKTENMYEIIPRLKDLMNRDPKIAKEVANLIDKMKGEHSKEVFKVGRAIATGAENKIEFMPKRNVATIASYGKSQNSINKNIIKVNKTPLARTEHRPVEINDEKILEFPRLETIQPKLSNVNGEAKVFNIESIGSTKGNEEIINKISNYVQQQNLEGKKSLDLVVRHEELGNFKLNVAKQASGEQLSIKIVTATDEGRAFFNMNGAKLSHALELAGIKVADIKIVSPMGELGKSEFDSKGSQSDQSSSRSFSQQGQDRNGEDRDSQRRRELWEKFQERNSA